MTYPIRLNAPISGDHSLRLHMFAGRYLSEQEFDLMQAYVDERCEDLLVHQQPGIVEGLFITVNDNVDDLSLRVEPGSAIGGDGRAIQLFSPLDIIWPALIDAYKARTQAPDTPVRRLHGFYYISLKRSVARVNETEDRTPCSRSDLNPLHDSRIETYGSLDFHFIHAIPTWMAMDKIRAANRMCAAQLGNIIFDADTGAVPLALVKIENDALTWVDVLAGRYYSQPQSSYHTFLNHWHALVERGFEAIRQDESLASNLGVDFLPSAGRFPDNLLGDIAGRQSVQDPSQWTLPELVFRSAGLHIELLPIPANTYAGIIDNEFSRGHINLVHDQQDRLRIMVAVNEQDYRPNLMDLPEIDHDLAEELYRRYVRAASDYNAWANQYYAIYHAIDRDVVFTSDVPDEDSQALFDSLYKVAGPSDAFANIGSVAQLTALGFPISQPFTQTAGDFFSELISLRRAALNADGSLPAEGSLNADGSLPAEGTLNAEGSLPRPYSMPLPEAPEDMADIDPVLKSSREEGLYRMQTDYQAEIKKMEENIEEAFELVEEVTDFIATQRQHLDAITVSFATLAGGIEGDGSGLNLIRWTSAARFLPAVAADSEAG